ncbi:hypothetical protein FC83_GL001651 [Agrilactobacillus composti DSM 18527 = JCM 14202]|uniref:Surface layer protein A domain-containing protein n=2 Tax=Agrilactobacillus TaxID=2767875 RepID=A0A0R1XLQ9_9LACO|nr:hypothetical protein FC83_GL001651 [Agrilactobacillus composti DSM 18527 = JCM 14202]
MKGVLKMKLKQKVLLFVGLLGGLVLALGTLQAKPVQAAEQVAVPTQDVNLLTINNYDSTLTSISGNGLNATAQTVPGLSVWQITKVMPVMPTMLFGAPYYKYAHNGYQVGTNLWLDDIKTMVLPVGTAAKMPVNAGDVNGFNQPLVATVANAKVVGIWRDHAFKTAVQTVAAGDKYAITGYYYDSSNGLWFDLGDNQWIPSYYVSTSLQTQKAYTDWLATQK